MNAVLLVIALYLLLSVVVLVLWCTAGTAIHRAERRRQRQELHRGIHDLEKHTNNPAVRAHYLNPDWKEDRP